MRISMAAWVSILAAGCVESGSVVCTSGVICPAGSACSADGQRCLDDASAACEGVAAGGLCQLGGETGTCVEGSCVTYRCGDGMRTTGEACEGGDLDGASCVSLGYYEETSGLGCASDCGFDVSGCAGMCDDGTLDDAFEACDEPGSFLGFCAEIDFDAGSRHCSAACQEAADTCLSFQWRASIAASGAGIGFPDAWGDGDDLFALASDRRVRRYDGETWTDLGNFPAAVAPRCLWGASASDLWVGGADVAFAHWDGGTWTEVALEGADVRDLWGFASDDVFAVTGAGVILHYDGVAWTSMPHPMAGTVLNAVWGAARDDVWAVGNGGLILHWDGRAWTTVGSPIGQSHRAIWGSTASDVWIVGATRILHLVDGAWELEPFDPPQALDAIVGRAGRDVFVGGAGGGTYHYDGTGWVDVSPTASSVTALWANGGVVTLLTEGLQQGDQPVYQWQGAFLAPVAGTPGINLQDVWALDASRFVAVGGAAYHFNGGTRIDRALPFFVSSLWGFATNDLWAVGFDGVAHFGGTSWTEVATYPGGEAYAVWGATAADVWIGDVSGVMHRFTEGAWTSFDLGVTADVRAISGTSSADVWVAGSDGALFHFDGTAWVFVSLGTIGTLESVWAISPDDVWVIEAPATAWHYDGAGWTPLSLPEGSDYIELAGSASDDVFALATGDMAHWDGQRWGPIEFPDRIGIRALAVTPTRVLTSNIQLIGGPGGNAGGLRSLVRTRFSCDASETACADGVDDDCDGATDEQDSDC